MQDILMFSDDDYVAVPDKGNAPTFGFGRYVHSRLTREDIRNADRELRAEYLGWEESRAIHTRGRSHIKVSDIAPFVFWDGEGITYIEGMPQEYVLFGASSGHEITSPALSTLDCLQLIIECEKDIPAAIHVGFSFKYDVEMILRDLPIRHWQKLKERSTVKWAGYQISYHPGRLFRISKNVNNRRVTATIYDVWGFFQGSFVAALRKWLQPEDIPNIDMIEKGKKDRSTFTYEQLNQKIRPYWAEEIRVGTILCEKMRDSMATVDLVPSQWHGAGALATTIYKKHEIRKSISRTERDLREKDSDIKDNIVLPLEVNDAARFGYAGGRFELFKIGKYSDTVYQYDINSAYPFAMTKLPNLNTGEWEFIETDRFDSHVFGIWNVEYNNPSIEALFNAGPLFCRDWQGKVSFPGNVKSWLWSPEISLIANNPYAKIKGVWMLHHDNTNPFNWVLDMYNERRERKKVGDASEKVLKLGLNSLY